MTEKLHPFCNKCGWRKGGVDSWDGNRCKCGHAEPPIQTCFACGGLGKVPCDIGSQPCGRCEGVGILSYAKVSS